MVYAIYMAMLIASVAMLILEYAGIRGFINVLKVPKQYLLPAVIALCIVGAFGSTNRMFDVYCTLGFGVLGYLMKKGLAPVSSGHSGLYSGTAAGKQSAPRFAVYEHRRFQLALTPYRNCVRRHCHCNAGPEHSKNSK